MTTHIPDIHYIEPDVVLVHKPKGITSFGLIARMRRMLGIRKIGHAGTLDPLAYGLMILGIGSGTKKMEHYLKLPKTYRAEIRVGVSTTTGDLEGEVVEQRMVYPNDFPVSDLEQIVLGMKGVHEYEVPLYSAIKVEGKPLYWYARNNKVPPMIPIKRMEVTDIILLDHYKSGDFYIISVRISVSSGTYIRTLGEELGRRLGYPATLQRLYRMTIGTYQDTQAFHLPEEYFIKS